MISSNTRPTPIRENYEYLAWMTSEDVNMFDRIDYIILSPISTYTS